MQPCLRCRAVHSPPANSLASSSLTPNSLSIWCSCLSPYTCFLDLIDKVIILPLYIYVYIKVTSELCAKQKIEYFMNILCVQNDKGFVPSPLALILALI